MCVPTDTYIHMLTHTHIHLPYFEPMLSWPIFTSSSGNRRACHAFSHLRSGVKTTEEWVQRVSPLRATEGRYLSSPPFLPRSWGSTLILTWTDPNFSTLVLVGLAFRSTTSAYFLHSSFEISYQSNHIISPEFLCLHLSLSFLVPLNLETFLSDFCLQICPECCMYGCVGEGGDCTCE